MKKLEIKIEDKLLREIRNTKVLCASIDCEFHDLSIGSRTEYSCALKEVFIDKGKCQKYQIKEEKKDATN